MKTPERPIADDMDAARGAIDKADRALLRLLAKRFEAIRRIASLKNGDAERPFLDADRERRLLATWTTDAESLGVPVPLAREVLSEILRYSRRVQEPLLAATPDAAPRRPRVAIQGVGNCYSALAAHHLFATRSPSGAEIVEFHTFSEAVEALEDGTVNYALLPVENSISGSIVDVNRLICDRALFVVDEELQEVNHVVAAVDGTTVEEIHAVRSHPAALAQCERFLRGFEHVARETWFDTTGAAESVARDGQRGVAAICSAEAAAANGLSVLLTDVADREQNETRFLLLAVDAELPSPRVPCKTSVVFRVNHHEGALASVLKAFADARANLTRIESRPNPETSWEYLFFVDVEGHQEDEALAQALHAARRSCNHLRIAGTYPQRTHQPAPVEAPHRPAPPLPKMDSRPSAPKNPKRRAPASSSPGLLSNAGSGSERSIVKVGDVAIGGDRFVLIAGPCAVESREQMLDAAKMVHRAGASMLRGGAYKPRTSPYSFQGLGLEGLRHLRDAGREVGLPVVTELLSTEHLSEVLAHADMIQVGARNMQNFPMLKELGGIDRPILLKRGMSATIKELLLAAEYILSAGNQQVVLCERGIRTFEPSTRGTLDLACVPVLRQQTHLPIIVDPSHAAGQRDLVVPLALAAVAAGADGLIVEAHPYPEEALCDREQALTDELLHRLVNQAGAIVQTQGRHW